MCVLCAWHLWPWLQGQLGFVEQHPPACSSPRLPPTHPTRTLAPAAVACGVDGLFMEVHDDPTTSPVDGPTQWPLRWAPPPCGLRCRPPQPPLATRPPSPQAHRCLPVTCGTVPPRRWRCRHLRRLLVELLAIAGASRGKEDFHLDLSPIKEEDFDPLAVV